MKFKEGDLVVITGGYKDHGIPVGTICEVFSAEEGYEFPYELMNTGSGKFYDNNVAEDEIEFVED